MNQISFDWDEAFSYGHEECLLLLKTWNIIE